MANSLFEEIRSWLGKTTAAQNYREFKSLSSLPKYNAVQTLKENLSHKSIVFLSPSLNKPSGGVKVIYNQAALINSQQGQLTSSILHPLNPDFNCTWFKHNAPFKRNLEFDPQSDFVMIPEFWAIPHARLLYNIGVQYGIYVQNGYEILHNAGEELEAAYRNAALILAISDDTAECIKLGYPDCASKVHRVHYSVNPDKFNANSNKENIICYMPRKLQKHSQMVTHFLNKRIPAHWRIESIDWLDEDGVAAVLGKSKIFLSFSVFEGCPLPPVEAALSGCQVVGYTGEGAKEYWDTEIFTEIYTGDLRAFVSAVLNKIDEIENAPMIMHKAAIQNLANRYSAQVELADMQFVSTKVIEILEHVR